MGERKYIRFRLWGEAAMWRHPSEALGHFSGAGPSPSNIAGILGASLGLKIEPTPENPRPVSPTLIEWLKTHQVKVASRLVNKSYRISTNVNALKSLKGFETFQLQRRSIDLPAYEILIELNKDGHKDLLDALKKPYYQIYLGDSNHLGKILDVDTPKSLEDSNWAYKIDDLEMEEYVWNTKFGTNGHRLIREGYWSYPAPNSKKTQPDLESCIA